MQVCPGWLASDTLSDTVNRTERELNWMCLGPPHRMQLVVPVMAILQDHLLVPSILTSSAWSSESMCVSGSTPNVVLPASYRKQQQTHAIQHTDMTGRHNMAPKTACTGTGTGTSGTNEDYDLFLSFLTSWYNNQSLFCFLLLYILYIT